MLKYDESIKTVLDVFPELVPVYESDEDYYDGLAYLFYESVFQKYIVDVINNRDIPKIKQIFFFIENVLEHSDDEFSNLIGVAVVESLYFEKNYASIKKNTEKYWGPLTAKSFIECEK